MYIDFMGDKAGIHLEYDTGVTVYAPQCDSLIQYRPDYRSRDPYANELDTFVRCA